jgi:hypothetical protein
MALPLAMPGRAMSPASPQNDWESLNVIAACTSPLPVDVSIFADFFGSRSLRNWQYFCWAVLTYTAPWVMHLHGEPEVMEITAKIKGH